MTPTAAGVPRVRPIVPTLRPGSPANGRSWTPTSRVAGFAGMGYAVGVGVENMDILSAPRLGSPAAAIRAAFLDGGHAVLGMVTGGLALVLFVVFAVGLYRHLSAGGGWARAGLVGGSSGRCSPGSVW